MNIDGCKVTGMKTHDFHILLQRVLPAGLKGIASKEMYVAIAELGRFFRELCAKTLKVDVLNRLKVEIVVILCKLEKLFPPAFFDVMVHLAIHLPEEALLRGPVHYGWMYPVERRLGYLKSTVRNKARPEGSIAEGYIVDECLIFCSRFLRMAQKQDLTKIIGTKTYGENLIVTRWKYFQLELKVLGNPF